MAIGQARAEQLVTELGAGELIGIEWQALGEAIGNVDLALDLAGSDIRRNSWSHMGGH